MPRRTYGIPIKELLDLHHKIFAAADRVHAAEQELIPLLYELDQIRGYVRIGDHSLRGYIVRALRFSRTQGQRITTKVRRYVPTVDF